jgi:hypothetical protein
MNKLAIGLTAGVLGLAAVAFALRAAPGAERSNASTQKGGARAAVSQAPERCRSVEQHSAATATIPPPPAAAPDPEPSEAEVQVARAKECRRRLALQEPQAFLLAVFPKNPSAEARRAQERCLRWIKERREALETMIDAYVVMNGNYDHAEDLEQLAEIDASFKRDVDGWKDAFPQLAELPDILGATALPLPFFAKADELARNGQPQVVFEDAGLDNPSDETL